MYQGRAIGRVQRVTQSEMNILERPCVKVFVKGIREWRKPGMPPEKAIWYEQSRNAMWWRGPGGGGAAGGMVAHDLVNGCQATA